MRGVSVTWIAAYFPTFLSFVGHCLWSQVAGEKTFSSLKEQVQLRDYYHVRALWRPKHLPAKSLNEPKFTSKLEEKQCWELRDIHSKCLLASMAILPEISFLGMAALAV